MWDDVTDRVGNVLLSRVFRLEDLTSGLNIAFSKCGINHRIRSDCGTIMYNNNNSSNMGFSPTTDQVAKIRSFYEKDFELYENSWL